jgi:hypothetical protein
VSSGGDWALRRSPLVVVVGVARFSSVRLPTRSVALLRLLRVLRLSLLLVFAGMRSWQSGVRATAHAKETEGLVPLLTLAHVWLIGGVVHVLTKERCVGLVELRLERIARRSCILGVVFFVVGIGSTAQGGVAKRAGRNATGVRGDIKDQWLAVVDRESLAAVVGQPVLVAVVVQPVLVVFRVKRHGFGHEGRVNLVAYR